MNGNQDVNGARSVLPSIEDQAITGASEGLGLSILALDPGTNCGWAVLKPAWDSPESGTQVFDLRRGESPGMRFLRFRAWLEEMAKYRPNLYVYEQAHHRGGAATEVCVGFTTRILEEAARRGKDHCSVHSLTLKKWACGTGKATKEQMMDAAKTRWGKRPQTEHEGDALLILSWVIEQVKV